MSFIGDFLDSITGGLFSDITDLFGGSGGGFSLSGIGSLFSSVTDTINNITGVVSDLAGDIHTFISPVTDLVDSVASLGRSIQDDIIGPIVTPITQTITQIEGLTTTINKLVDQGIGGILQIPKAISDALTGVAKAWDNSTRQLADANAKIASETLVPGIHASVAPGLQSMAEAFLAFSKPSPLDVDSIKSESLAPGLKHDAFTDLAAFVQTHGKNPTTWYDWAFTLGYYLILYSSQLAATFEPIIDEARAEARAANPTTLLDVGDLLLMLKKGITDEKSVRDELLHLGYDKTRQDTLIKTNEWLPDIQRTLAWWLKGIINNDQFIKLMSAQGLTPESMFALQAEAKVDMQPQVLLDMLARGIIDQVGFDDQLKGQGYTADQIKQIITAGTAPPQLGTLIAAKGNLYAGLNGWFTDTYASVLPDDLVNVAHANRIPTTQAAAEWTSHWSAMPISMAVNLYFRGQMNRQEVQYVVGQNNYPPEMVDLFISSQEALLAPRSIPAMLARGAIDETTARSELKARGYNDIDINTLIDDAKAQAAKKLKAPAAATTHLTISEITEAHTDGVLTDAQYSELLTAHGFTDDEIKVLSGINDIKALKRAKADLVATLKAEVALGVKTVADVQTELVSDGFTMTEIERILVSLHQQKRQAVKLPTLAEMSSMLKKSIITQDDFLAGIQALGYADPWDTRLLALTVSKGASDGGSPATA